MTESTAFPNFSDVHDGSCAENPGLSKLEFYAAMAMQGLLARPLEGEPDWNPQVLANVAVDVAIELEKRMVDLA